MNPSRDVASFWKADIILRSWRLPSMYDGTEEPDPIKAVPDLRLGEEGHHSGCSSQSDPRTLGCNRADKNFEAT
jgi:hypothetical protein